VIEQHHVYIASAQRSLQISPELRLNAKAGPLERCRVDVHRHIDIAQSTGVTARLRAEEVGLLHLGAACERGACALDQLCGAEGVGHDRNLAQIEAS